MVTSADPLPPGVLAVILAVPGATPVTVPLDAIVAMFVFDDDHVSVPVSVGGWPDMTIKAPAPPESPGNKPTGAVTVIDPMPEPASGFGAGAAGLPPHAADTLAKSHTVENRRDNLRMGSPRV